MAIFQRLQPRNPFKGAEDLVLSGISQLSDQSAIDRALKQAETSGGSPIDAILRSNASLEKQQLAIKSIQARGETQRKGRANDLVDRLIGQGGGQQPQEQNPATPAESEFLNEGIDPARGGAPKDQSRPGIQDLSEDELLALSAHNDPRVRSLSTAETKRRANTDKRFLADRDFNTKASQKWVDQVNDNRTAIRQKVSAGKQMISAIETGDTDIWSANNFARITGVDAFRDATGQQLVTAGKEYFVSNLERVKGRPNQYIEEQLKQAIPQIGQNTNAQMVAGKTGLADSIIGQTEIEITDRLVQEDLETNGFVGADLAQRVAKELKPIAEDIEQNLAYDIRKVQERELGIEGMQKRLLKKVPSGSVITPATLKLFLRHNEGDPKKALQQAKRLGWTIPTPDQFRAWEGQ